VVVRSGRGDRNGRLSVSAVCREAISKDCRQYSRWTHFWLVFYILLAAVTLTVHLTTGDQHLKHAMLFGIIGGCLGVGGMMISPLTGIAGDTEHGFSSFNIFAMPLKSFTRAGDTGAEEQAVAKLAALRERAEVEHSARLLVNRLPGLAVVSLFSLLLWLVLDEPGYAVVNLVIGLLITQAQLYTQPTAAMKSPALVERAVGR
jgi:hypothetical protein